MKETKPYILRIPLSSSVLKERHRQFFRKICRYMAKYQRLLCRKMRKNSPNR